jgi:pyruvate dehydrogenase E2 component (dihydrolipoamide acetyltransferase)
MAIDVRMPKLSDNMEEGTIIRWMKAPGDQVEKGEPLAEVETDKADVELEASDSGVLQEIKVPEGQSATVGAVIAVLGAPDQAAEDTDGDGSEPRAARKSAAESEPRKSAAAEAKPTRAAAPARPPAQPTRARAAAREEEDDGDEPPRRSEARSARAPGQSATASQPAESRSRAGSEPEPAVERPVRASPLAWRLADEAGVNLSTVRGSGPGGRVLQRDVEASVRAPSAPRRETDSESDDDAADTERETKPSTDTGAPGGIRVVEASRMRLAIAKRMAEAKRDIPHFYVTAEINMSEAMHLRESIKRREAMPGLTVTHLLLRGVAIALVRHPRVNASWRDGSIELHDDVNIGIAVAVEDGLVVPVLHRAQELTLSEIAARAGALTEKARSGKFSGAELTGGTFSLSNVGMLDVEELIAVINPPQAAILAVGAVKDRPIVSDGQLAVAKTMRATLSCDHRVLNGVEGGRFLEELKSILENPVTLLLE